MNSQISDFSASYGGRSGGAQQSVRQQPEPLMGNLDAGGIVGMRPSTAETQLPGSSFPVRRWLGWIRRRHSAFLQRACSFSTGFSVPRSATV